MTPPTEPEPYRPPPRRLTTGQRWRAAAAAFAPIGLVALTATPFAIVGAPTAGDVVVAALVYGGLLGLATGFLYVDRVYARQCPRCGEPEAGTEACPTCGYDLHERPRFACSERHQLYLDAGVCHCGRRLQALPVARGVNREIVFMLKLGGWLLAFLLGVGLLLQQLS